MRLGKLLPGKLLRHRRAKVTEPAARQSLLTGTCSRCGLCCEIDGFRCLNLINAPPGPIVPAILPGPTTCAVYDRRYDGMPIVLMDDKGHAIGATCGKGSLEEDMAIVERGVGKGCSMKVVKGNGL